MKMTRLRSFKSGLMALLGKSQRNHEIEDELQAYMQDAIDDKMNQGMSRKDAVRAARIDVGSAETVKHKVWNAGWESKAELFWSDLLYTLRRLMRSPGLVFAVVLSIGLGLGANATIFSLISKFVLAPAPMGDPKTLLSVFRTFNNGDCCNNLPMPVYRDLREQAKSFSGLAAYYELVAASIGGGSEPERVWGQATTANYFDVAQLRLAQGRGFCER